MQGFLWRYARSFPLLIIMCVALPINADVFVRDTAPALKPKSSKQRNLQNLASDISNDVEGDIENGELDPAVTQFYASIGYAIHPLPPAQNLMPQQYITKEELPQWAYSNAILEAHFSNGDLRTGFATMMKNGFFITSSEIVRDNEHMPREIYARMQDTSADNILCVARLTLKAVDLDSGLALLEYANSTDKYCNAMPKTYYQDRILKKNFINVFDASNAKDGEQVLFALVDDFYYFRKESGVIGEQERYYDFKSGKYVQYGFKIDQKKYKEMAYGKAFFNTQGKFVGLVSMSKYSYLPTLIRQEVVQDFLCSLDERSVVKDEHIHASCASKGNRERFFRGGGLIDVDSWSFSEAKF